VEAITEPRFNLHAIQATTNPVAPLTIINGPIRKELNVNCGSNALGQGWRANATIGRAIRLILVNVGGGLPGTVDKATLGMPGKYSFCVGEDEEESPWEPLHVERGLPGETSAVTTVGAAGTANVAASYSRARVILACVASAMGFVGSNNWPYGGEPLVILCPSHARILAKEGYTKEKLKLALYERTIRPASDFEPEYLEHMLARNKQVVNGKVTLVHKPEDFMVVVAGGPGGIHSTVLATFGETWAVTKPVARPA
ncbi:MAG: UGSC family (seleno)protein, partial [Chloroflexota bacterium]